MHPSSIIEFSISFVNFCLEIFARYLLDICILAQSYPDSTGACAVALCSDQPHRQESSFFENWHTHKKNRMVVFVAETLESWHFRKTTGFSSNITIKFSFAGSIYLTLAIALER